MRRSSLALSIILAILLSTSVAWAKSSRVALIIGNGNYETISTLKNPASDAQFAQDLFTNLGFETLVGLDLNAQGMRDILKQFSELSIDTEVALIYFAGHGVQIENKNFLLPVDVKSDDADAVEETSISLELLTSSFASSAKSKLLLLDACRTNPFTSNTRAINGNSLTKTRGLARTNHEVSDLMVVYAAQPNHVALDGVKENSPFVLALENSLQGVENVKLSNALVDITNHVRTSTLDKQVPYIEGTLSVHVEFSTVSAKPKVAAIQPVNNCKQNLTSLPLMATKVEEFVSLNKNAYGLHVTSSQNDVILTICLQKERIEVSGKFSATFACDQLQNSENEGVGYYFTNSTGSPAHVWFHLSPENSNPNLEMGFYLGNDQQKWIETSWELCG